MSEPTNPTKPALLKPEFSTIASLVEGKEIKGRRGKNIICKVVGEQKVVVERGEGDDKLKISEVLIGDATGTMILSLSTDEQRAVASEGADLIIRNSQFRILRGFARLRANKFGLIEAYDSKWGYDKPPTAEEVKRDNNISEIEYERPKN